MKVKDLIASLSKINQELDVICCLDDSSELLEIDSVSEVSGITSRVNGKPVIKFSETPASKFALLEITSDI